MISLALAFGLGLVVGWNFLPQPAWVKDLIEGWTRKIKGE